MAQYQDIIKNGEVTKKGQRECESRYVVIKEQLKKFQRPFTVLDIGANLGYFSFRIAYDFPNATCVMIEDRYSEKLKNLCDENNLKNIILLKQKVDADILKKIADCEHFDVVLALNVVHHIGDIKNTLSVIEQIGETIIIETPHYNDEGACGQDNLEEIYNHVNEKYTNIGSFSRHTSSLNSIMGAKLFTKNSLKIRYWDYPKEETQTFKILSDEKNKIFFHPDKKENRDWIKGINFRTFQYLNGIYPIEEDILNSILSLKTVNHNDLTPWNLIINGKDIVPIDNNDPRHLTHTIGDIQIEKIFQEIKSKNIFPVNYYKP
jgi:SAM-dependent methyltransferase